jgi:hypothetical protein
MDSTDLAEAEPMQPFPTFIYSYEFNSDKLWRTHLVTAEDTCHRVPSYLFKYGCCWTEISGGSLILTGGGPPAVKEVRKIDTLREFAVLQQPPMRTARGGHACVLHAQVLYVLGGWAEGWLRECERYVESRWEALPSLPRACNSLSGVVMEGSLYALGCTIGGQSFNFIQRLRLEELTWEILKLRLPASDSEMLCFKRSHTEVYLVIDKVLYSFTPLQVHPRKSLPESIFSRCGPSYYSRGTLYCSNFSGAADRLDIGSLN